MTLKRRDVLAAGGLVGGALASGVLAVPAGAVGRSGGSFRDGYGPLKAAGKELALPAGFTYRTFGAAGSRMSDGLPTPGCHDGQAVFPVGHGRVRVIRNHEIDSDTPGIARRALSSTNAYDRTGPAGVTSSLYDLGSGRLLESFLALNGTLSNCGGAATPGVHGCPARRPPRAPAPASRNRTGTSSRSPPPPAARSSRSR
ncbi:alkaline phosphatase PhoX [Paractinoplanes durhamensis]|uniref:alkaline phosphatase PhoX n=1 Tax=Paractinoplanes durhamensis TaxID=113563 RepID=UPI00363DEDF0